ncbi:MAG: LacI family transcriptional regulator [Clostridiales bacterium]|nr:LacI family transcriptional regulator [Clostridiales bacterium]
MNQKDIARLAGVSSATVSRVINGDDRVAPKTYEKVKRVIDEYGYVHNAVARNLKKSSTKTIGYLVPDINNPFFTSVLVGFEEMCYAKGYDIIFENTCENVEKEKKSMQTLLSLRVDGLLAVLVDTENKLIDSFDSMGIPIVLIDRKSKNESKHDCIIIDNYDAVKKLVDHLVSLGHTDIATIYGSLDITPGEERLNGFLEAMKQAGIPVNPDYVVPGYFTVEGSYEATEQLLKLKKPPTAIITANNLSTMGAYAALVDHKIRIPQDISLVGIDDFLLAGHLTPPLTVVRRSNTTVGRIAGEMLMDRIEMGSTHKRIPQRIKVLPTELCVRESSGKPRNYTI